MHHLVSFGCFSRRKSQLPKQVLRSQWIFVRPPGPSVRIQTDKANICARSRRYMTGRSPDDRTSGSRRSGTRRACKESSIARGGAMRKASLHRVNAGPIRRRRPTPSADAIPAAKSSRIGNNVRSARSPSARSPLVCSKACRQSPGLVSAALRRKPLAQSLGRFSLAGLRGSRANRSLTRSCDSPRNRMSASAAQACPSWVASAGIPCVK